MQYSHFIMSVPEFDVSGSLLLLLSYVFELAISQYVYIVYMYTACFATLFCQCKAVLTFICLLTSVDNSYFIRDSFWNCKVLHTRLEHEFYFMTSAMTLSVYNDLVCTDTTTRTSTSTICSVSSPMKWSIERRQWLGRTFSANHWRLV